MNCNNKPLYHICSNCRETFDSACYHCWRETLNDLKSEGMDDIIRIWNKRKIIDDVKQWLEENKDIEYFFFGGHPYELNNLIIKRGGTRDIPRGWIINCTKKWMSEHHINTFFIFENKKKKIKIISV